MQIGHVPFSRTKHSSQYFTVQFNDSQFFNLKVVSTYAIFLYNHGIRNYFLLLIEHRVHVTPSPNIFRNIQNLKFSIHLSVSIDSFCDKKNLPIQFNSEKIQNRQMFCTRIISESLSSFSSSKFRKRNSLLYYLVTEPCGTFICLFRIHSIHYELTKSTRQQ